MRKQNNAVMIVLALLCTVAVSSVSETVKEREKSWKRSDDASLEALQVLIQQQAATIQSLQADVTSMKNKMAQTEGRMDGMQANVSTISTRLSKQVTFSAYMSNDHVDIGESSPIKFDHVITNIGAAFNGESGVFVAPYAGTYIFHVNVLNDLPPNGGNLAVALMQSNVLLCQMFLVGDRDQGACTGAAHLSAGDHVFVRRAWGTHYVHGSPYTAFTGFLLSAD